MAHNHTATATGHTSFWGNVETALRGFGQLFSTRGTVDSGLEALEREHARIRLTSRHWLMG